MQKEIDFPLYLFHQGTNYEAYRLMCPHPAAEEGKSGWWFRVWAPAAKSVSVIGDWNYWDRGADRMQKISVGVWEAYVENAREWQLYRYSIETADGRIIEKTDPYALHTETSPSNAGKLVDLSGYQWSDADWMKRRGEIDVFNSPMNIYEMHIGSWRRYPDGNYYSYRKVAEELIPYLKGMHYTHVEFMPLGEYPLNDSWGYQCTGMFAATSRYGAPKDLMYLVDELHKAGIGVIVDWVPAHFPKDSFGLGKFDGTCLYEYEGKKGEHPDWGTYIYDYGRNEVRSFLVSSAVFWFDLYHIDGIRMDAVSSMLYLSFGRNDGDWQPNCYGGDINLEAKSLLQTINASVHYRFKGALMIAEESTAFPKVTAPTFEDGLGFDFKWNMGWMNDTLRYIEKDPVYRKYEHYNMTFGMVYAFSEHYILALSHDEVVHGKRSLLGKQPGYERDKFGGLMTYMSYQMAHPGKKLIFMGAEFGQYIEWDFRKGLDWFLMQYPTHNGMQAYTAALNDLYLKEPALWEQDCGYEGFQWHAANDNDWNILAWRRIAKNGDFIIVVLNFSPVYRPDYMLGVPEKGHYEVVLNSYDKRFGVGDNEVVWHFDAEDGGVNGLPYHITLGVTPNSAIFLKKTR